MAGGEDPGRAGQRLIRLRWRLRGAWQWPVFATLTVAEAVMLHLLPIAGDSADALGAFLLCGFANLGVVALLAPLAGRRLQRHRPQLPRSVASDYAGTALMLALFAALLAVGLAHRPAVRAAQDSYRLQLDAVRRYLAHQAPAEYARNIGRESTWKQAPDLYRTCVPGRDPARALCLIVDTSGPNPTVVRDPDQQPNSVVAGPDNPGRRGA
jgi:hypothetical protein